MAESDHRAHTEVGNALMGQRTSVCSYALMRVCYHRSDRITHPAGALQARIVLFGDGLSEFGKAKTSGKRRLALPRVSFDEIMSPIPSFGA